MQIEEGYRMNAKADTFLRVADPDCVSLENSVLYMLTSKPDLSCRNCNKGSCITYCIGTMERRRVMSRYHGSTISGRQQNIKIPNFTSLLYGVGEHNTKIVASFF